MQLGTQVSHTTYGRGVVEEVEGFFARVRLEKPARCRGMETRNLALGLRDLQKLDAPRVKLEDDEIDEILQEYLMGLIF